ncbi:cation diffusion facilitator family transporter [Athalassotoga saccharophila]|uniref:cation diffusion facilitator family transporter n=1 Tax=Athalassotoga saccharophila TaxID=1441386 RepID=UPI00137B0633|nr:cation diffusion facilitator family transporter [Athalassotoga saccharophila]BBJ28203.1 putative cation efflux system protein [Athalassotoga saccharophila]
MEERTKQSLKTVKIGIYGNAILAIFKVLLGIISGSIALISDGIDTIMDVAKSILAYQGIKVAGRPPDIDHPYGHGRAETIVANIIGISVIFAGFIIVQESFIDLGHHEVIATIMIVGASISIVGKFFLSYYMFKMGKRFSNQAVIADAKDYMSDVFASVAVLVGGVLVMITGMTIFDPIASIAVAVLIVWMGIDVIKTGLPELMEKRDPAMTDLIEEIVKKQEYVFNPHLIRVRKLGSYYIVDMHVEMPGKMRLQHVHTIMTSIEDEIKKKLPEVKEVTIHAEPIGGGEDEWPDIKE